MFKNRSKYPNVNTIASFDKLTWENKIFWSILILYRYKKNKVKRKNFESPKWMLKVESIHYILQKLKENSNMKDPEMVEFLKENYNVEVSRSIVRRALIKTNYSYIDQKNIVINILKKILKNCEWDNYFEIGLKSYFLMRLQYIMKNSGRFKLIHNED